MKILYVVHSFPPLHWRGTEVYAMELATAMAQEHEAHVFHLVHDPVAREVTLEHDSFRGLPVHRARLGLEPSRPETYFFNPELDRVFHELLNSIRPQVVHFIYYTGGLSLDLPRIAKQSGAALIVTVTDLSGICPRGQLLDREGKSCPGPRDGLRCFWCLFDQPLIKGHSRLSRLLVERLPPGFISNQGRPELELIRRRLNKVGVIFRDADQVIYPNRNCPRRYQAAGITRNGLIMDYGIDTAPFAGHRKKFADQVRIGFVGQLLAHKGLHVLAAALHDLPGNWKLIVHGSLADPGAREYFDALELPADRLEFRGAFPFEQMNAVLEDIDVLVVPSIWDENCPLIVKYALATDTLTALSDQPGIIGEREGKPGLIFFKPGDPGALRAALAQALDRLKSWRGGGGAAQVIEIREQARELSREYQRWVK